MISIPSRRNLLFALKRDVEISSGQLAAVAGAAASAARWHLAKLAAAGLVTAYAMGRKRKNESSKYDSIVRDYPGLFHQTKHALTRHWHLRNFDTLAERVR